MSGVGNLVRKLAQGSAMKIGNGQLTIGDPVPGGFVVTWADHEAPEKITTLRVGNTLHLLGGTARATAVQSSKAWIRLRIVAAREIPVSVIEH